MSEAGRVPARGDRSAGHRAPAAGSAGSDLERAFRAERATVVARIARRIGDLQIAEDAVQEAFASAAEAWAREGVPDSTVAWLTVTARRKAIDRLRRDRSQADRARRLEQSATTVAAAAAPEHGDDLLLLMCTCCHPALALEARLALTLRCVNGLSTADIAGLFVVAESTMAQRLVRAKRKIRDAGLVMRPPEPGEVDDRLADVRRAVYLLFTTGWNAPNRQEPVDRELCEEALWLGRVLVTQRPDDPETAALLALILLTYARVDARRSPAGAAVTLDLQDRTRWRADLTAEGLDLLATARHRGAPGQWWLQAAIAAEHSTAATADATDWPRVAALYRALEALTGDPVVRVNRAVAVGRADGARAGLALLRPLASDGKFSAYAPFHAAVADLSQRAGDPATAREAWARVAELSTNTSHGPVLQGRLRRLSGGA